MKAYLKTLLENATARTCPLGGQPQPPRPQHQPSNSVLQMKERWISAIASASGNPRDTPIKEREDRTPQKHGKNQWQHGLFIPFLRWHERTHVGRRF